MTARTSKIAKEHPLLMNVAESIGSTLGTIVAKANAAQKAVSRSGITDLVEREGKKIVRTGAKVARETTKVARKARKAAATKSGRRRVAKTIRRATKRAAQLKTGRRASRSRRRTAQKAGRNA